MNLLSQVCSLPFASRDFYSALTQEEWFGCMRVDRALYSTIPGRLEHLKWNAGIPSTWTFPNVQSMVMDSNFERQEVSLSSSTFPSLQELTVFGYSHVTVDSNIKLRSLLVTSNFFAPSPNLFVHLVHCTLSIRHQLVHAMLPYLPTTCQTLCLYTVEVGRLEDVQDVLDRLPHLEEIVFGFANNTPSRLDKLVFPQSKLRKLSLSDILFHVHVKHSEHLEEVFLNTYRGREKVISFLRFDELYATFPQELVFLDQPRELPSLTSLSLDFIELSPTTFPVLETVFLCKCSLVSNMWSLPHLEQLEAWECDQLYVCACPKLSKLKVQEVGQLHLEDLSALKNVRISKSELYYSNVNWNGMVTYTGPYVSELQGAVLQTACLDMRTTTEIRNWPCVERLTLYNCGSIRLRVEECPNLTFLAVFSEEDGNPHLSFRNLPSLQTLHMSSNVSYDEMPPRIGPFRESRLCMLDELHLLIYDSYEFIRVC